MSEFSQKLQPWSSLHNVKEAQQVWGISTHLSWSEWPSQKHFSVSLKREGVSTSLGQLPQLCEAFYQQSLLSFPLPFRGNY